MTVKTETDYFLRADEVYNTISVVERNPHIVEDARNLGAKGFEDLKTVARHLIILNETNQPEDQED